MTPELVATLCDHAQGNHRALMNMAGELLAVAAQPTPGRGPAVLRHLQTASSGPGQLECRFEQGWNQVGTEAERLDLDFLAIPKDCRYARAEHLFRLRQGLHDPQVRMVKSREL